MVESNQNSSKASILDDSSLGAERVNTTSTRSIENEVNPSSFRHRKSTLLVNGFAKALGRVRRVPRASSAGSRFLRRAAASEDDTELVEKNRSTDRDDEQMHRAVRWYAELAASPEYQVLVLGQLHM
jgi:hypothetical protein